MWRNAIFTKLQTLPEILEQSRLLNGCFTQTKKQTPFRQCGAVQGSTNCCLPRGTPEMAKSWLCEENLGCTFGSRPLEDNGVSDKGCHHHDHWVGRVGDQERGRLPGACLGPLPGLVWLRILVLASSSIRELIK